MVWWWLFHPSCWVSLCVPVCACWVSLCVLLPDCYNALFGSPTISLVGYQANKNIHHFLGSLSDLCQDCGATYTYQIMDATHWLDMASVQSRNFMLVKNEKRWMLSRQCHRFPIWFNSDLTRTQRTMTVRWAGLSNAVFHWVCLLQVPQVARRRLGHLRAFEGLRLLFIILQATRLPVKSVTGKLLHFPYIPPSSCAAHLAQVKSLSVFFKGKWNRFCSRCFLSGRCPLVTGWTGNWRQKPALPTSDRDYVLTRIMCWTDKIMAAYHDCEWRGWFFFGYTASFSSNWSKLVYLG